MHNPNNDENISEASANTVDLKEIETLRSEVGEEDFKILLASFYKEVENRLKAMEKHITDINHDGLELDSHTLKSLSRTFGAVDLGNSSAALEEAAKKRRFEHYKKLMGQIREKTIESLRILKEHYKG